MPIATLRLALWLFLALAIGAAGTMAYRWAYDRGAQSRQSEFDRLKLQALTLTAANETANAEAIRRQQEAAQAAKAIEDEQRRRIEETEALVASYNALAELGAADYSKRLRNAAARACRQNPVRRESLPEAAERESRGSISTGVFPSGIFEDTGALLGRADWTNEQFLQCLAIVRSGREVSR